MLNNKCKNRISIALLGSYPPIRGISPYCSELSESLSYELKRIVFLSFKKIYPSFLYPDGANQTDKSAKTIARHNIEVRRKISWYNPISWFSEANKNNFDLLHAQWWSIPLFPIYFTILSIIKLKKIPIVLTVHNALPHEPSIVYEILTSMLFKLSDHFIVHTKINKDQLSRRFNITAKAITIIPHGPIGAYADSDAESTDVAILKKKHNISEKSPLILVFGAIREYKGIDIAIKSLKKLNEKAVNCHLLIAGKAWIPTDPYRKMAKDLNIEDKISFHTDYIPESEVKQFFDSADLILLPYKHFDAQSGVASVVASFGKPMIVSDTGGLSDWVSDKRWAVTPGDIEALAEAIENCINNPDVLSEMAADSKKLAKLYSWKSIAKKTNDLYTKLLDKRTKRI